MTAHLLTTEELAAHFRVRPSTVSDWAARGLIPCLRPTLRVVRFDLGAVHAALERRGAALENAPSSVSPWEEEQRAAPPSEAITSTGTPRNSR